MFPAIFIQHGGGPLPILGKQPHVAASLKKTAALLPRPRGIIVISAHWESSPQIHIQCQQAPGMVYDYGGFPPEAYTVKYPAPGDPALARDIQNNFASVGIPSRLETERGYDHGTFIPLMLMYPAADIPVVAVAQPANLDPAVLLAMGRALRRYRSQGYLILGSGGSFHSFKEWRGPTPDGPARAKRFDTWLQDSVLRYVGDVRGAKLSAWEAAPEARFCHPREEHLTPLITVAGAAGDDIAHVLDNCQADPPYANSQFVFGLN